MMKGDGHWKKGVLGVITGDALGCPVQFETREEFREHPIDGMRGNGTFDLPEGSWTDDSSLTLALLDSIRSDKCIRCENIASRFLQWLNEGKYTPYGFAYDIGKGCLDAISRYERTGEPLSGGRAASNNGNGSLMRIMPACIYAALYIDNDSLAIETVEAVSCITHAHKRARVACGIYCFIVKELVATKNGLFDSLQNGINQAFKFYEGEEELSYYNRIRNLREFMDTDESSILSTGYVVPSLEAALWCLANTGSYRDATIKAANLGGDTDTICAIAGGLAGLYYGIGGNEGIPEEWINALQRKDWIIGLCDAVEEAFASESSGK